MMSVYWEIIIESQTQLINTFFNTSFGLIASFCISIAIIAICRYYKGLERFVKPLLLIPYIIPPFFLNNVLIISMNRNYIVVICVLLTTLYPFYLLISKSLNLSYSEYEIFTAHKHKFILAICLKNCLPSVINAFATVFPWGLLSALLSEIGIGYNGIGLALFHARQDGEKVIPYCIIIASISIVTYLSLNFIAKSFRLKLKVGNDNITTDKSTNLDTFRCLEILIAFIFVLIIWTFLSLKNPILIPSISKIIKNAAYIDFQLILNSVRYTVISVFLSTLLGLWFGGICGLLNHYIKGTGLFIKPSLMALQIIPLVVFLPVLYKILSIFEVDNSLILFPICIATLACAYAVYQITTENLQSSTIQIGVLSHYRPNGLIKFILTINLPWLATLLNLMIAVSIPRVFLASLATEFVFSGSGIGYMGMSLYSSRSYTAFWVLIMTYVAIVLVSLLLASFMTNNKNSRYYFINKVLR